MEKERQEKQRYGRDKNTIINHTYVNSGEYRNKFDKISNNKELNRLLYQLAKKMLYHRSGTQYEDMYWVDMDTLEIVASETNQTRKSLINYSKRTKQALKQRKRLLAIHTHPNSMPPSLADINSAKKHKYEMGLVCCHNGKIYLYRSQEYIFDNIHKRGIAKYKRIGYDEFISRLLVLKGYEKQGKIVFKEVI